MYPSMWTASRLLTSSWQTIPEDMDAIHRDLVENPDMQRIPKHGHQSTDVPTINQLLDGLLSRQEAERIYDRYINEICPHFPAVPIAPGVEAAEVREKKPLLFLAILAGSCHGSEQPLVPAETQRNLTNLLKDKVGDILWRHGEKSLEIVQSLQLMVLWYGFPAPLTSSANPVAGIAPRNISSSTIFT